MGFYIETPHHLQKGRQLVELYGAEIVTKPEWANKPADKVLICVVENGPFDAAGVAYSEQEFNEFKNDGTGRYKTWLLMDRAKVIELVPWVESYLQ